MKAGGDELGDVVMLVLCVFFFNDTATTEIYTLSLHDALPICLPIRRARAVPPRGPSPPACRSEEHTSELQSRFGISYAVFCLKKKKDTTIREHARRAHSAPGQDAPSAGQ